jgi:hypothetical protein
VSELVGTSSREMRWVRGTCAVCGDKDVLVYVAADRLVCASHYREYAAAHPRAQACDKCGATGNVWRDPLHRRNEYLCIKCHDPDALFQNRWANKVRESSVLGVREKVTCEAAGYGTDCKGEIKYRSAYKKSLCNKHAGRQGVGPNG